MELVAVDEGVPPACLSLCTGVIVDSLLVTATTCIPYIGNIVLCYEEGTELLPGPVNDLQAEVVDDTSVYLEWEPP
ncbi:fibronectin type [Holotrichia oblita]|uniref:Fibronectin type n=1 Tax=Holotrichia oblita TaxID=644536 RepID=A0ACB9SPQ4_HOLOL|nr:fibronectin type [Holotrichia oblita]